MYQIFDEMLGRTQESLENSHKSKKSFKPESIAIEILSILNKATPARKYESFFWPYASLTVALEYGYLESNNRDILDILTKYYKHWEKTGNQIYFLDQIMNGYSLIFLNYKIPEQGFEKNIHRMYKYIRGYPRTRSGSLPYRINGPEIVLVDYLGMICPFLSRYGSNFNCEDAFVLASHFIKDFLCNGMDAKTGLPYHGFRSDTHEKLGIIGWGRGVGWLLIGMIDTLAYLDRSTEAFQSISNEFQLTIESIVEYQDEDGYFKWMLTANEGHIDTSATAMIGYSVKRAMDINLLGGEYRSYAEKALKAIEKSTIDGQILDSSAECQGIGMYPQRYEWNRWGQGFGTAFALIM